MEERKPDAKTAEQKLAHVSSTLQTLVKDIDPAPIDNFKLFREELRKELGLPDNRVWTGVGLLLAVRQLREKHNNQPLSESANREPLAKCQNCAKVERELQELRAELYDTCKMVALQTNDAAKIGSLNREIASLRGLVGRMLTALESLNGRRSACKLCNVFIPLVKANMQHKPDCLISEAEAAIKEPSK